MAPADGLALVRASARKRFGKPRDDDGLPPAEVGQTVRRAVGPDEREIGSDVTRHKHNRRPLAAPCSDRDETGGGCGDGRCGDPQLFQSVHQRGLYHVILGTGPEICRRPAPSLLHALLQTSKFADREKSAKALNFDESVRLIERGFTQPLPGDAAHARLAPRPRREWPDGFDRRSIRDAAALLLVFPVDARAHVVLTVRAGTLGRHGGQVSMPGGVIDPGETREHAALREAHEEIGVNPGSVRVLGLLTPLDITVSGFRLYPVVGVSPKRPRFIPAPGEVERVLEVDLDHLANPASVASRDVLRDGRTLTLPAFLVDGVEVWGATAMVLAEFLALLSSKTQEMLKNR